jgi:hypothetical protein
MSRNRRYDDILAKIAQRKQTDERAQKLVTPLDAVNATGFLEDIQAKRFREILCHGPKVCHGEGWMGSVLWFRQQGYYGYKTLYLLGIWTTLTPQPSLPQGEGEIRRGDLVGRPYYPESGDTPATDNDKREGSEDVQIIVGTRALSFAVPGYDPAAYHKIIQTRFDIYYNDAGAPPDEKGQLYSAIYEPTKRLEIRAAIKSTLQQWVETGMSRD